MTSAVDHVAFGKCDLAIEVLATSTQPIQGRLYSAGLQLSSLRESDFRDGQELDLFRRVRTTLNETGNFDGDDGRLMASTKDMDDEVAMEVARNIVALYRHVIQ